MSNSKGAHTRGINASREIETRPNTFGVELRSSRTIGGVATQYGARSRPLAGQFVEVIEHRAWAKSESDGWPDCRATYEHRDLLGTTAAGTLRLFSEPNALGWECDLPNTRAADDCLEHVRLGNVKGSSVEMQVYDDTYGYQNGMPLRLIHSARLLGVSACATPAYPTSTVALRTMTLGLARQFDADEDEIADLLARGEARSLFERTDLSVPAPVTVPPTPRVVARRSHDGSDIDLQRRRLESQAKKIQMDTGRRPDEKPELSTEQRLLELRRRKMLWDQPVEARSYACYSLVPEDEQHDWHPWR